MKSLRRRTIDDCSIVLKWLPDAESLHLFAGPRLRWPIDIEQLRLGERSPGSSAWVMIDATGVPVGQFELVIHDRLAHLGRVIIAPDKRGRGLSHDLISLAIDHARDAGATEIGLNVDPINRRALHLYESASFVLTGHTTPTGALMMRMEL